MELKNLSIGAEELKILEKINEEAIPDSERNSLSDLLSSGATVTGIYSAGEPVGFLVTRVYKNISYLAYLAIRSDLRSKGLGGISLRKLLETYPDKKVVVEFEAETLENEADDFVKRRKNFYMRNGFAETGWFTFYDDTEFEIGCANNEFDIDEFNEFTEYLSSIISDHIPEPYRKA
ncbi:MAG: GNAT family N-acetyltransferase [Lachnospiraceae bacterium]|nr:GNAT family N-acetyltransferase [Lachnospiraceae bacterium]